MKDKFTEYSDDKLIDIVKNAKVYGYSEEIKNSALEILESRGIDQETLRLQGNLSNQEFEKLEGLYEKFNKYSKVAFTSYFVVLAINVAMAMMNSLLMSLIGLASLFVFILFFVKSFISQNRFYESIKINRGQFDLVIFFIVGMPLYFIMFFYFRGKMKAEMHQIK